MLKVKKVINTIALTLPGNTTGTFATGQEVLVNGKTYTVSHTSGTATATLTAKTAADRVEGTATSPLKITAKNGAIIVNTGLVVDSATPVIETAKFNDDKTKITVTFSEAVTNSNAGFFEKLVTTDFDLTGLTGTPTVTAIEHNESTANQVVLTLNAAATSALVSDTITVLANEVYDFAKNAALTTGTANITGALLAGPAAPTGLTATSPTTVGGNDGKIGGLTAGTVYQTSSDGGATWVAATLVGTEITGLAAGTYKVRVAATATQAAGAASADVVVTP